MKNIKLDKLNIIKMASGHFCLELTEQISWDSFPEEAKKFLKLVNGEIIKTTDSTDIRIWEVIIREKKFNLTFDDYPVMMSLESDSHESDLEIERIKNYLQQEWKVQK
jgi:hypothetical protein